MIFVTHKIGDTQTMLDGFPIDWWIPSFNDYTTLNQIRFHFRNAGKVFQVISYPDWMLDTIKSWFEPYGVKRNNRYDVSHRSFKARRFRVNYDKIALKLKDSNYRDKLHGLDNVPILDFEKSGLSLSEDFADTSRGQRARFDNNAWSSGDQNFGSGETYTSYTSYLNDAANFTGDGDGIMTSSTTETGSVFFTEDFNSYTWTTRQDTPINGDPTSGHVMTISATGHFLSLYSNDGTGSMIWDGLNIVRSVNASSTNNGILDIDGSATVGNVDIIKSFIDGGGLTGTLIKINGSVDLNINRCVLESADFNINSGGGTSTRKIQNCLIHSAATDNIEFNGGSGQIDNCGVYSNSGGDAFSGCASVTAKNNFSDDLTGENADFNGSSSDNDSTKTLGTEINFDISLANCGEPKLAGSSDDGGYDHTDFSVDMANLTIVDWPVGPKIIPTVIGASGLEREFPRGSERGILRGVA